MKSNIICVIAGILAVIVMLFVWHPLTMPEHPIVYILGCFPIGWICGWGVVQVCKLFYMIK